MKKIFFILLLFLFPIDVMAEENDEFKTEYRFFKEVKQGEYEEYSKENSKYQYTDETKFYYEESTWQWTCEENGIDEVEYAVVTPIQKIVPIRYIKLINQGEPFHYRSFQIIQNNLPIEYEVESCSDCEEDYLKEGGELLLFIEKGFYIDEVEFLSEEANYQIEFNNQKLWTKVIAIKKVNKQTNFKIERTDLKSRKYTDLLYKEVDYRYNGFDALYSPKELCKIHKKYVYRYNIVKEYAEGYYENLEGYQKDTEQYRIVYPEKEPEIENEEAKDIEKKETESEENSCPPEKENIEETFMVDNQKEIIQKQITYKTFIPLQNTTYSKAHFYIYLSLIFLILLLNGVVIKNLSKKKC